MAGEEPRNGDYRMARIGAALALVGMVFLMFVADTLLPDYDVDPIILTIMVSTICTLLGREFIDVVRKERK